MSARRPFGSAMQPDRPLTHCVTFLLPVRPETIREFAHGRARPHPDRRRRRRDPQPARPVSGEERPARDGGRRRPRDVAGARRGTHRPRRARPDAAGRRRPHAVPEPAREVRHPGHHAHRARRGDRPHRRPRDGRRRLPRQAVQRARAAGAHQGDPAPRAQPAGEPAAGQRAAAALRRLGRSTLSQRQLVSAGRRRHAARAAPSTACCGSSWAIRTGCSIAISSST